MILFDSFIQNISFIQNKPRCETRYLQSPETQEILALCVKRYTGDQFVTVPPPTQFTTQHWVKTLTARMLMKTCRFWAT